MHIIICAYILHVCICMHLAGKGRTHACISYFLEYTPGRLFLSRHRAPGVKTRPAYTRGRRLFPSHRSIGARYFNYYFNSYYGEPRIFRWSIRETNRDQRPSCLQGYLDPALREELIVNCAIIAN